MSPSIFEDASKKLQRAAAVFKTRLADYSSVTLVHHYDCDGICSAAIMMNTLRALNKHVKVKVIKQLYTDTLKQLGACEGMLVFVDFGSNHLDVLSDALDGKFFVIDHHQVKHSKLASNLNMHVNINMLGLDGGVHGSASTTCYLLSKYMLGYPTKDAVLAVVGAVGDIQNAGGRLLGLNRVALEDAVQQHLIRVERDLRFYGRVTRPLWQFLAFASNPMIPGLTGNEKACKNFLHELNIPLKDGERWRSYATLTSDEKKRLITALALHMQKVGVPSSKIERIMGETYTLLREPSHSPLRDASEFATLLNACGRAMETAPALCVCLGDRQKSYHAALRILTKHRNQLRNALEFLAHTGVEERQHFYFFDARNNIDDSIVGIVAGLFYGGIMVPRKPIIAFAQQHDGAIKVSARCSHELAEQGVNLGKLMRECCAELGEGNEGGGHKVAAGCRIMPEEKQRFLTLLENKLAKKLYF